MVNRTYQIIAKAGVETKVPISGNYFLIASVVAGLRPALMVTIRTDDGQYMPLRQGEGLSEPFKSLMLKNDTLTDFTVNFIYGNGNFVSLVTQSESAHTVSTSDQIILDASAAASCSIFMPGVVLNSAGQIMRRAEIQIQNIAEPTGNNPLSVQFQNSIVPVGVSFDSTIPAGTGTLAMSKAGYVFGLGKASGGNAIGQKIPVDATGAAVRTFKTDASLSLIAVGGAVNTVLLTQFWYLLNA